MKKSFYTLVVILLSFNIHLQSQCTGSSFQKVLGGVGDDEGHSIKRTFDGGFVLIGGTTSFGAGGIDIFVTKMDINGNVQWTKSYGTTSDDDGASASVIQTLDGGYLIMGETEGFGAGSSYDAYLLKLDSIGNVQWEKRVAGTSWELFRDAKELSNGDFILVGNEYSIGLGSGSNFVVKLSSSGSVLWSKSIGGSAKDDGMRVLILPNGDFMITSYSASFGAGQSDALLFRIDTNGNVIWGKSYGGSGVDAYWATIMLADGNLMALGNTKSFGSGNEDILLSKLDPNGNIIWSKVYGGTGFESGSELYEKPNGDLILGCSTNSFGFGSTDILLLSVDSLGNINWSKTYGGTGEDDIDRFAQCVTSTLDSGIIVVGRTTSFGSGGKDIYIVKTNSCGETFCNEQDISLTSSSVGVTVIPIVLNTIIGGSFAPTNSAVTQIFYTGVVLCDSNLVSVNEESDIVNNILVYPNPVKENVIIQSQDLIFEVIIYNNLGQVSFRKKYSDNFMVKVFTNNLPNGVYFIAIETKKGINRNKIIITH